MKYWHTQLDGINLGFARIGGTGLGNLLFPWPRAIAAGANTDSALLHPVLPQIKIGPILRRPADTQGYWNIFQPAPTDLHGISRLAFVAVAGCSQFLPSHGGRGAAVSAAVGMFVMSLSLYLSLNTAGKR